MNRIDLRKETSFTLSIDIIDQVNILLSAYNLFLFNLKIDFNYEMFKQTITKSIKSMSIVATQALNALYSLDLHEPTTK